MKRKIQLLFYFSLIMGLSVFAQSKSSDFAISLNYNYTTTSRLFLQPNSSDPIIRGSYSSLDDIYHYSFEVRYRFYESMFVGISSEYIEKTFVNNSYNYAGLQTKIEDGYRVVPIEITVYYEMPFSTEQFKFFTAGGFGFYLGDHIRHLGDANLNTLKRTIGYGIHVAIGLDYFINDYLSLRGQMRFRDPEFEMQSQYDKTTAIIEGRSLRLNTTPIPSKVNIDGVTFVIGATFNFNFPF